MNFSERAKPLKDKNKIKLSEIAEACNISESMVSRYINGQIVPPEDIARRILEFLGEKIPEVEKEPEMQSALALIREIYEARLGDMRSSIEEYKDQIESERKEKSVLFCFFGAVVICILFVLCVDLLNGDVGWFRH